jgi:hypothetical protein
MKTFIVIDLGTDKEIWRGEACNPEEVVRLLRADGYRQGEVAILEVEKKEGGSK